MEPRTFEAYKKLRSENSNTDGYLVLIMGCARSPFRDFDSYLKIEVGLYGDDIRFILKQDILKFVTYEHPFILYSYKDTSEVVYTMGDQEVTLQTE